MQRTLWGRRYLHIPPPCNTRHPLDPSSPQVRRHPHHPIPLARPHAPRHHPVGLLLGEGRGRGSPGEWWCLGSGSPCRMQGWYMLDALHPVLLITEAHRATQHASAASRRDPWGCAGLPQKYAPSNWRPYPSRPAPTTTCPSRLAASSSWPGSRPSCAPTSSWPRPVARPGLRRPGPPREGVGAAGQPAPTASAPPTPPATRATTERGGAGRGQHVSI